MNQPTPLQAAPGHERRRLLVADVMASLDEVPELPVREQLARLDEAQSVLAAVLNNQGAAQVTIPGTHISR